MRCPVCQSENIVVQEATGVQGYGFCKGLLGIICFGPIGLICGFLGFGKPRSYRRYIVCNNCGSRSSIN